MSQVMKKHTIKILNLIDKNATHIDISNNNICGVLDMSDFDNLKSLYCNSNNITYIIGLSNELKILNCCSNPLLKNLNNLPKKLEKLICSNMFENFIDKTRFNNSIELIWFNDCVNSEKISIINENIFNNLLNKDCSNKRKLCDNDNYNNQVQYKKK